MALTREMIEHLNTFLLSIPDRTPENWHLGALPREFSAEIKMAIVAAYMSGLRTDDGAPPIPVGSVPVMNSHSCHCHCIGLCLAPYPASVVSR
ncbi:uncharacterized protein BROUX77_003450 [Berkeleyomyces rouxiae]|uniref:uncharacterized protein n=1 Tax=Berkeleyomyces rouxiae TaxID=2035830 RepID=UPI003B7724CB